MLLPTHYFNSSFIEQLEIRLFNILLLSQSNCNVMSNVYNILQLKIGSDG